MITTAEPVFYARTDAQRDEAHRRGLPNAETPVLVAFDAASEAVLRAACGSLS